MKKIFTIILIIALWLYSCSKEKVIENKKITQDNQQDQTYPTKDSCWIISCWLQKHLEEQYQNWKISIEKIDFFKKRLSWLLMRFSNKDALIKSPDFKTFVDDFYKEFYYWENNYSYDEKNYFRYISLPQIISEAFNENNIEDNWEYLETVMTSIKERYFTSTYEKEALAKDFEDTLKETVNKIDISKIDKEKLKNDKKYFSEIILTPNSWIYDKTMNSVLDMADMLYWEEEKLKELKLYSLNLFFWKINELWVSKELFLKEIWNFEENAKKLENKVKQIDKTYSLNLKIPNDRYLRHDEIIKYVVWNIEEFNKKWEFNKDILEIKHLILLQFSYENSEMQTMQWRLKTYNWVNNFLTENMFKYSKWLPKDLIFNY